MLCLAWNMTLSLSKVFFYRMNEELRLSIVLKHTFQKDNFYRYVIEMFLFCHVSSFYFYVFLGQVYVIYLNG